jgi:hypothetical protein
MTMIDLRKIKCLAIGATIAFGTGCLIPQSVEPMTENANLNRPPAFNLESVQPSAPRVEVNIECREEAPKSFWAEIVELDVEQDLVALWFWNYDVASDDPNAARPLRRDAIPKTGTIYRSLPAYVLPAPDPDPMTDGPLGPNTLEVFVVERDALINEAGEAPPFYRNLRDCRAEGYPDDCVSTHPAVMRWTVVVLSEGGC